MVQQSCFLSANVYLWFEVLGPPNKQPQSARESDRDRKKKIQPNYRVRTVNEGKLNEWENHVPYFKSKILFDSHSSRKQYARANGE